MAKASDVTAADGDQSQRRSWWPFTMEWRAGDESSPPPAPLICLMAMFRRGTDTP